MKNNLTTGAWQHDIGCPIKIILLSTSDGSFLEGDLDLIGLFQTLFDSFVWHAISNQRRPLSIPVELGHILCLEKI